MRGRRPQRRTIARRDADAPHHAAHRGPRPWFRVQRAKIAPAIAAAAHPGPGAAPPGGEGATVRRAWRRYRRGGPATVFADGRRGDPGRPRPIAPVRRARVAEPARRGPIAEGLPITRWSGEDLARPSVADAIAPEIG